MRAGIRASFHLDSAPAPAVILILTAMVLAAYVARIWQAGTT